MFTTFGEAVVELGSKTHFFGLFHQNFVSIKNYNFSFFKKKTNSYSNKDFGYSVIVYSQNSLKPKIDFSTFGHCCDFSPWEVSVTWLHVGIP